jgi:tetratricopeptide (TPR) repeat protein
MEDTDREAGLAALRAGDFAAAITHLQRAVGRDPADHHALAYLGIAYSESGQPDRAILALRSAAELTPSAAIHHHLGQVLERAGRTVDAAAAYRAALSLDPAHAHAREALSALETLRPLPPAQPPAAAAPGPARPPQPAPPPAAAAASPLSSPWRRWLVPGIGGVLVLAALVGVGGYQLAGYLRDAAFAAPLPRGKVMGTRITTRPITDPEQVEAAPLDSLTPLPSGFGVQVCEPVSRGASRSLLAFGSGCARWLQYSVARQPELGKTPSWAGGADAARTLRSDHLRAGVADLPVLSRCLGCTHAVLTEVAGTQAHCTLTCRLYDLPTRKPVGAPIAATGSTRAVLARLPRIGKELASRLGVRAPRLPSRPTETPAQLSEIGAMPWGPKFLSADRNGYRLAALAEHSSLAALLYVFTSGAIKSRETVGWANSQVKPEELQNPLMLAELARASNRASAGRGGKVTQAVEQLLPRYPNNSLLHLTRLYLFREARNYEEALREAETTVRCLPESSSGWLAMGGTYAQWAQAIRRGRTIDGMTLQERKACRLIYRRQLGAVRRAAQVDPTSPEAVTSLSTTAAFYGDLETAHRAFERVVRLYPHDPDVLWWGLQLYHPKWGGERQDARRVVALTRRSFSSAGSQWSLDDRLQLAVGLYQNGYPDVAQQIAAREDRPRLLETMRRGGGLVVDPAKR